MQRINQFIDKNMNKILIIFLFLQPLIDVLTAIMLHAFKVEFTIGIIIRMLFLVFMIYYLFFINKLKGRKKTLIYIIFIFIYILLFAIHMNYKKETFLLPYEIKSLIKTFYFPILLVIIYELFKMTKNIIKPRFLKNLFIIYSLLVFIPNILGIGFDSYAVTKSGNIGLFYTANEIGAIIAILMPIFISVVLEKKNYLLIIISGMILLYILTSMGTKGPLLSFIIIVFYYLLKYIHNNIKRKKYKVLTKIFVILIGLISAFMMAIPKTNFYKNMVIHLEFLEVKKARDIIKSPKVIDHFIFSERLTFWKKTNEIYQKDNVTSKLLGIGYSGDVTSNTSMKMVEMDFVDIFYRHGILGFLIYMSSFFYMVIKILKKYFNDSRIHNKNKIVQAYMLSTVLSIILALLTGHVMSSPSVSIFVALIFNLLYNELYKGEFKYD